MEVLVVVKAINPGEGLPIKRQERFFSNLFLKIGTWVVSEILVHHPKALGKRSKMRFTWLSEGVGGKIK